MSNVGTIISREPTLREIWVQRKDNILEYKLWVIYPISFQKETEKKIISFLNFENKRFDNKSLPQNKKDFVDIVKEYTNLETISKSLPPRLVSIKENDLNAMETELISNENNFIFGDSVGGISPNKQVIHNQQLLEVISSAKKILINPGVLARIEVNDNQLKSFIFQLAEKNLRKKEQVFYKPIGGHLKYKDDFKPYIEEFNLELKDRDQTQDTHDLSLFVEPNNFLKLSNIFKKDLMSEKKYEYIEDPQESIYRELQEEIGHIFASDGISLLDEDDMKLINTAS